MQSFSHSLSVADLLHVNVRSKCECAHTMQVGMVLVVMLYVPYTYIELKNKFHHLTYLREARCDLSISYVYISSKQKDYLPVF